MITRLYLDNCFTHQDVTFTFEEGLTGITGQNESGKSLIVEMIRYALFGSAALRGQATDYKDLHVELDFEVKGRKFGVIRKKSKAELTEFDLDHPQIATGTKPVNDAIRGILGYDLLVFDVANACNQGNIEALTSMRPTERKTMVDRTIGLDVLDRVIDFCAAEANGKKREAGAFQSALVEPKAPQEPEAYRESYLAQEELTAAEAKLERYNELKGLLSVSPQKPTRPKACPVKEKSEVLRQYQKDRDQLSKKLEKLELEMKALKLPDLSKEDIEKFQNMWRVHKLWLEKKSLLDKGENECPKCGHHWPYEADRLEAYADVYETEEPSHSEDYLEKQARLLPNIEERLELADAMMSLETQLMDSPDRYEDLQTRVQYETQLANYEVALDSWKSYNEGLEERQAEFQSLEGVRDIVVDRRGEVQRLTAYEKEKTLYDRQRQYYENNLKTYNALLEESNYYAEARKNIQALKLQVKSHLLPSLNKVSSILLNNMTGGERSEVVIDDDFEIEVDGQKVNTLSGSGKAVANLAIRIALGQILTNKVFSLFMADEVDAAMDDERAAYTAEALRNLTKNVKQVVLVTHKQSVTDHSIELRKA